MTAFVCAAVCYAAFLAAFLYAVAFVGGFGAPLTLDAGRAPGALGAAVAIDLSLLALFGLQHSIMARASFKRCLAKVVSADLERSAYVLASAVALALLFWQWRPIPAVIWHVETPAVRAALLALFGSGWLIAFASTFMIDHFDFFGLRAPWARLRGRVREPGGLRMVGLYRVVRHPLMLGVLIAFWATPLMTAGHALFAGGMTAYIAVGTWLEERDLVAAFGDEYRRYRRDVPAILPLPRGRSV